MNNDRLKAGVTQATAASALFKSGMDIAAFQEGLTKADEAIQSLKVASGMVTNYPQSSQPYTIAQKSPEELRAAIESERIEMGEGGEEEEKPSFEPGNIGNPFSKGAPIPTNISKEKVEARKRGVTILPNIPETNIETNQGGGGRYIRRTRRNKQKKRRASTRKQSRRA